VPPNIEPVYNHHYEQQRCNFQATLVPTGVKFSIYKAWQQTGLFTGRHEARLQDGVGVVGAGMGWRSFKLTGFPSVKQRDHLKYTPQFLHDCCYTGLILKTEFFKTHPPLTHDN
jgi:hypothetical protein